MRPCNILGVFSTRKMRIDINVIFQRMRAAGMLVRQPQMLSWEFSLQRSLSRKLIM